MTCIQDVFNHGKHVEIFRHNSDVLAIVYRPDGKQLATSTLDGQIIFWEVENGIQTDTIEDRFKLILLKIVKIFLDRYW
ncbi:unnamed protein product [Rhizophagus irregularis]|nr:unnamed protein product [Rhizophagus irregularis]